MDVNVIQFLHPGGEHGIDDRKKMIKYWNHGPHKRKFLKARGQYVTARGTLSEQVPHSPGQRPGSSARRNVTPCKGKSMMKWLYFCPYRASLPSSIPPRVLPWAMDYIGLSARIC